MLGPLGPCRFFVQELSGTSSQEGADCPVVGMIAKQTIKRWQAQSTATTADDYIRVHLAQCNIIRTEAACFCGKVAVRAQRCRDPCCALPGWLAADVAPLRNGFQQLFELLSGERVMQSDTDECRMQFHDDLQLIPSARPWLIIINSDGEGSDTAAVIRQLEHYQVLICSYLQTLLKTQTF